MRYEEIIFRMHRKYRICLEVCNEIFDIYKKNNEVDKLVKMLEG